MKAIEVYQALHEELGTTIRGASFKKKASRFAYLRNVCDFPTWIYARDYGVYLPSEGGQFLIEFAAAPEEERYSVLAFSTDVELEEARVKNNAIVEALPPRPPALLAAIDPRLRGDTDLRFLPPGTRVDILQNSWMRYSGRADVAAWASWLRPIVLDCARAFEEVRSRGIHVDDPRYREHAITTAVRRVRQGGP